MRGLFLASALSAMCASAVGFAPSAQLAAVTARARRAPFCVKMSADDKNADMMLKMSLNQMEAIKGREGLSGKDADRAISEVKLAAGGSLAEEERKLLGSRRLAKAAEQAAITQKYERNEKLAFDTMINSLQSMLGRDGFKGEEAEKTLREIKEVNIMAHAEEQTERRMLGSRRVYKFVRAATRTISRPVRRKNHPGEVFDARSGHR